MISPPAAEHASSRHYFRKASPARPPDGSELAPDVCALRRASSYNSRRNALYVAYFMGFGAEEGTRTPTPLRVRGPEPRASANSATSAHETAQAGSAERAAILSLANAVVGVKFLLISSPELRGRPSLLRFFYLHVLRLGKKRRIERHLSVPWKPENITAAALTPINRQRAFRCAPGKERERYISE